MGEKRGKRGAIATILVLVAILCITVPAIASGTE
ncbi:MAG: hypothetical protein XE11_0191 [Methanomicrobiales archaeon 53_19]|nr:MAG: hypothetical protein XE11_0191 [Methanomicrobiales archaeon 53_19]